MWFPYAEACWRAACTAPRKACALYVAPLTPFTLALCLATTWEGIEDTAEIGYSVATFVMLTLETRPPLTVTATLMLPRRLVPVPLNVPSLYGLTLGALAGVDVAAGLATCAGALLVADVGVAMPASAARVAAKPAK